MENQQSQETKDQGPKRFEVVITFAHFNQEGVQSAVTVKERTNLALTFSQVEAMLNADTVDAVTLPIFTAQRPDSREIMHYIHGRLTAANRGHQTGDIRIVRVYFVRGIDFESDAICEQIDKNKGTKSAYPLIPDAIHQVCTGGQFSGRTHPNLEMTFFNQLLKVTCFGQPENSVLTLGYLTMLIPNEKREKLYGLLFAHTVQEAIDEDFQKHLSLMHDRWRHETNFDTRTHFIPMAVADHLVTQHTPGSLTAYEGLILMLLTHHAIPTQKVAEIVDYFIDKDGQPRYAANDKLDYDKVHFWLHDIRMQLIYATVYNGARARSGRGDQPSLPWSRDYFLESIEPYTNEYAQTAIRECRNRPNPFYTRDR